MAANPIRRLGAALLLTAWLAAPAIAQPAGAPATAAMPSRAPTEPGTKVSARVEERIRQLHARLKIAPAQQSQWDNFVAVMRQNAAHMAEVFAQRGDPHTMTAIDDLHAYAALAQARAQDLERLVPAFEQLYASFTPEQRRAADAAFRDFQRQQGHSADRS